MEAKMRYKVPVIVRCRDCPSFSNRTHSCKLVERELDSPTWWKEIPDWCPLPDAQLNDWTKRRIDKKE